MGTNPPYQAELSPINIHFHLYPFDKMTSIAATGENLNWYKLTQGYYWIEAGSTQLFRYTDSVVDYWRQRGNVEAGLPFVDYWVAELLDDLLGVGEQYLRPLPPSLIARVSHIAEWNGWVARARQWLDDQPEGVNDRLYSAISWWPHHRLSTSYLSPQSPIWFWNDGQFVHAGWDNRNREVNGMAAWTATLGQLATPQTSFLQAIQTFHAQLLSQMAERIVLASRYWRHPAPTETLQRLQAEQNTYAGAFERMLARVTAQPVVMWDETIIALTLLEAEVPRE